MRIDRRIMGLVLVTVALAACGTSAGDAAPASTTGEATTTEASSSSERAINLADLDTVRRYVAAMNRRDVDAAMRLRCMGQRIKADDKELFAESLDRLLDDMGEIGTATVIPEEDHPITPAERGEEKRTYEVQFQTASGNVGSPLYVALIGQGGERRLCGASPVLVRSTELDVPDSGGTDAAPEDLMPEVTAPGYRAFKDEAVPPVEKYDEVSAWFQSWKYRSFGGASAFASQHPTDDAAAAAVTLTLEKYAPDAVGTFEVPGLPDAVGVTVMSSAWLMIQPPGTGPTFDAVVQRFGDRLSSVRVTDQAGQRALVVDLAHQVHDLALS